MTSQIVALTAIVAITIIIIVGLSQGIDGNVLIASISVLGGLGGYVARQVNHKPKT